MREKMREKIVCHPSAIDRTDGRSEGLEGGVDAGLLRPAPASASDEEKKTSLLAVRPLAIVPLRSPFTLGALHVAREENVLPASPTSFFKPLFFESICHPHFCIYLI